MRHVLAALAAIAVVAFIAWAGTTVFEGSITADSFTGDLTGDVTGDLTGDVTGAVLQDTTGVRYQGNLPTAASHYGEIYMNASAMDSAWISNGTSWVQLAP